MQLAGGEITYPYTTLPTSNLLCHNFERHTIFLFPRSLTGDLDAFFRPPCRRRLEVQRFIGNVKQI